MAQIKKKFIQNAAVDGDKILLLNNQPLKAKNAAGSEEELMKLDNGDVLKFLKMPQVSADPVGGNDVARKTYVDGKVADEATARASAISAEQSARESADSELDGRLDVIEGADNVSGSIAKSLKDAKAYADQKITDLVGGAPGVLDTLKEIADALGSDENFATTISTSLSALDGRLDTVENPDETVSGSLAYTLKQAKDYADSLSDASAQQVAADLAAEVTARENADNALDGRLDVLEGSGAGSVAKALVDAKDYTDQEVSSEAGVRASADSALDARLDIIEGDSSTAGSILKAKADAEAYADGIVQSEQEARESADSALDGRLDILEGDASTAGSVAKAKADAQSYADGIVSTEASARQSADNALDARLDIIEGSVETAGSILKAKADAISSANTYTDGKITDLIGGAPAMLDTLKELADQLSNDEGIVATLTNTVAANLQTAKDYADDAVAAEAALRLSGDQGLQSAIDALTTADVAEDSGFKYFTDARAKTAAVVNSTSGSEIDQAASVSAMKSYVTGQIDALSTSDIEEGSNQYFTEGRAQTASVVNAMSGGETVKAPSVSSVKSYIDSAVSNLQDQVDDANAAITDIQSDVADLQAKAFQKQKFVLSSGDVASGYVELSYAAVQNSLHVFTNSLFLGQGDDYTVSVVGGVTRITFAGDFASGGASALEAGDVLYCQYQK